MEVRSIQSMQYYGIYHGFKVPSYNLLSHKIVSHIRFDVCDDFNLNNIVGGGGGGGNHIEGALSNNPLS